MQTTSRAPLDDDTIDATVTIRRPVEEVFAFYRDFRNLPRFLGDVVAVEPIDAVLRGRGQVRRTMRGARPSCGPQAPPARAVAPIHRESQ
jgi:uncharacterized protein YndB with AHSA1/START domain